MDKKHYNFSPFPIAEKKFRYFNSRKIKCRELLILYLLVCATPLFAQGIMTFRDGNPAKEVKYTNVEGKELLSSSWESGWIKEENGAVYKGVMLKYNMLMDKVFFLGKNDVSMEFLQPPMEFGIVEGRDSLVFKRGFPAIDGYTPNNYFQVLVSGHYSLLEKLSKSVVEEKSYGYGSSANTKRIADQTFYYVYSDGRIAKLDDNKESITSSFPDKKESLADYLSRHKVNFKKKSNLTDLFLFLNEN